MVQSQVRAFGAGPKNAPDYKHTMHHRQSENTTYKVPSSADTDFWLPKKGLFSEKLQMWIAARWAVDQDDNLTNSTTNKYSAYHAFNTYPFLRSGLIWNFAAMLGRKNRDGDNHAGLANIQTHENGIHLYKSNEARSVVVRQLPDYLMIAFFTAWMGGGGTFFSLPVVVFGMFYPRKLSVMRHFCWHAELLPHTEQVVFHKTNWFGAVDRHIVNIRNLEKIGSEECNTPLMWLIHQFDPDLIFRDTASREIFVFDRQGHWNQEALEHKLLY